MSDGCPNCGTPRSVITGAFMCSCTWAEMGEALEIKRRREREQMRRDGQRVIVDHTGAGADKGPSTVTRLSENIVGTELASSGRRLASDASAPPARPTPEQEPR